MKKINTNIILVILMIVIAAVARIVNAKLHLPNYAPLIAISLFSGAIIKDKRWLAFMVPVFGQLFADVYFSLFTNIPGFYSPLSMLLNYSGLLCATALGCVMKMRPLSALGYTLGAAIVFFLVSNFGYFLEGHNSYTVGGLIKTYVDGAPFFKSTFEGNMVCAVILFGSYFLFQHSFNKNIQKVPA